MHATSVTNVIDRLEAAGLVRREPNPRDGRGTLAVLTDDGRAVAEKATADLNAARFGLGRAERAELRERVRRAAPAAHRRRRLRGPTRSFPIRRNQPGYSAR